MTAGRFAEAAERLRALLGARPDDADALYMAAVCARYLKRADHASRYLDRLIAAAPEHGRAWQERGHLARDEGRTPGALSAYRLAVRYNPALIAAWRGVATAATGEEAQAASAQAARLSALPGPLLAASDHLAEGRIARAEHLLRAYLQKNPRDTEGMRLLAQVGVRMGVLDDADFLLETAIALSPDDVQLQLDHVAVLRKRQRYDAALARAEALIARNPDDPLFRSHHAVELLQAGRYDQALAAFDALAAERPKDPGILTSRAHALKTCGQQALAVESYRAATRIAPGHGDAWYGLANLKTHRFDDADIAAMRAALSGPALPFAQRVGLTFALGEALEDAGDTGAAFAAFERGNAMKRSEARYTSEQMDEEAASQKRWCPASLFTDRPGAGDPAPDPIFIVGLPRAGSTLIEQILASHSQVDGTLELPNVLSIAHGLRGRNAMADRDRYPRVLGELPDEKLAALGRRYLDETRVHRGGAPRFTDKMPNNFRHLGLIHLMLPNAKIIDARRDPLDCCWSGFKQLFAEGQEFTYGLSEIGHYYRACVDLMDHWERALPNGTILRVQHEDVLDDLDGQVRRMLSFLGLPFEQACVDFHRTERAVRTASSEQVREPISRRGVGRWQAYDAHLGPLYDALGPLAPPRTGE